MAILNRDCKRMATVRTLCFCELRMLSRVSFLEALVHFPKMMQKLANYSKARAEAPTTQHQFPLVLSKSDPDRSDKRKNSSSMKGKPASYRLNWRGAKPNEAVAGQVIPSVDAETLIQLDKIKQGQLLLTSKIKDMVKILDEMEKKSSIKPNIM